MRRPRQWERHKSKLKSLRLHPNGPLNNLHACHCDSIGAIYRLTDAVQASFPITDNNEGRFSGQIMWGALFLLCLCTYKMQYTRKLTHTWAHLCERKIFQGQSWRGNEWAYISCRQQWREADDTLCERAASHHLQHHHRLSASDLDVCASPLSECCSIWEAHSSS